MFDLFSLLGDAVWLAPVLIFAARVSDVSLGTFRIILISRGMSRWAALTGFFESLIWLIALSQVFQHLDHWVNYVAYAGGYATGTGVGVVLERRIALGLVAVRIITREDASELIESLRAESFGVTRVAARGLHGRVRLIFTIAKRKNLGRLLEIVRTQSPKAFVSVSDVRAAEEGYLPSSARRNLLWGLMKRK